MLPGSFASSGSASPGAETVVSGVGLAVVVTALGLEGGAKALQTWRAEALHDLERNSMGCLGLSGSLTPSARVFSDHLESMIPEIH